MQSIEAHSTHTVIDVIAGRQRDHATKQRTNHESTLNAVLSMALYFNQL